MFLVLRVSRYKFDRNHEFILSYKVVGGHLRSVAVQIVSKPEICQDAGFRLRADALPVPTEPLASVGMSGCNGHYIFVLSAGAKAKSVTNNLPILSVLALAFYYFIS